ncbi:MAG: hypothetical protein QW076_00320 [Candidatus Anstonellales archaeon]
MTVAKLIDYIRLLTKTTSSQFTDSELIDLIQIWLHKVQRAVVMTRSDFFGTKSFVYPEVNQEDIPLPDDCMEVKAVEVCYNANADEKDQIWYKGEEIDIGQLQVPWDTIQKTASYTCPKYDILDNRLWIAPIRNYIVGNGAVIKVRLWYIARPPDPTTLMDTPLISSINRNLLDYQPIIALGVAYDILTILGSPRAPMFLQRYETDISKMVREIKQQNIGALTETMPYNDGAQY